MWGTARLRAVGAVSTFLVGIALLTSPADASPRLVSSTTTTIGAGVTLTKITDPAGPYLIRVLTIDPQKAATLDVAPAAVR